MPWDRKRLLGYVEIIQFILGVTDKYNNMNFEVRMTRIWERKLFSFIGNHLGKLRRSLGSLNLDVQFEWDEIVKRQLDERLHNDGAELYNTNESRAQGNDYYYQSTSSFNMTTDNSWLYRCLWLVYNFVNAIVHVAIVDVNQWF